MDLNQGVHSIKSARANYPVSILENANLINSEKYSYLKNKLFDFYTHLKSSRLTFLHYHITPSFQKQLYVNLHLILTEIVLTTDKIKRQNLLEEAYKWYLKSIGTSKAQSPSSKKLVSINLKLKKPFPPVQKLKKIQMIENKHSPIYFPKQRSKTPRDCNEKYTKNYNQMLENEKISFNVPLNHGFNTRTPKKQRMGTSLIDPEQDEPIQMKKQPCRTPEIPYDNFIENELQNPIKDFRKLCHKFRIIKPVIINREKEQILYSEANEIEKIKQKMSKKSLPVDIKSLENALCMHQKVKLNTSSQKRLPTGGELLLKSPFNSVKRKNSLFRKRQNSP